MVVLVCQAMLLHIHAIVDIITNLETPKEHVQKENGQVLPLFVEVSHKPEVCVCACAYLCPWPFISTFFLADKEQRRLNEL